MLVISKDKAEVLLAAMPALRGTLLGHAKRRVIWTYRSVGISIFSKASDEMLRDFAERSFVRRYTPGALVASKDETVDSFYVIVSGSVRSRSGRLSALLEPGHYFGDVPLLLPDTPGLATYSAGGEGCSPLLRAPSHLRHGSHTSVTGRTRVSMHSQVHAAPPPALIFHHPLPARHQPDRRDAAEAAAEDVRLQ